MHAASVRPVRTCRQVSLVLSKVLHCQCTCRSYMVNSCLVKQSGRKQALEGEEGGGGGGGGGGEEGEIVI